MTMLPADASRSVKDDPAMKLTVPASKYVASTQRSEAPSSVFVPPEMLAEEYCRPVTKS